jgi:hypothetical protein
MVSDGRIVIFAIKVHCIRQADDVTDAGCIPCIAVNVLPNFVGRFLACNF